jgi:hypothetical protein
VISSLHGENYDFSKTPLLFKGSQAWSVCLSAKNSSEDDDDYGALVKRY